MSFPPALSDSSLDSSPLPNAAAILVIDEDAAFQLGLKTFLREYVGFEKVFTAKNAQEALEFIRAEPLIEIITLDYEMPEINGIEFLDQLRSEIDRPLAAIMITGHPSDELEGAFHARASEDLLTTHFLTKPILFEKLEPVILAAHTQVIAAKIRRSRHEPRSGDSQGQLSSDSVEHLMGKLDSQSIRIADLEKEIRSQRGKWRCDFFIVLFILFLIWFAGQLGWLQRVEPEWIKIKETVKSTLEARSLPNQEPRGPEYVPPPPPVRIPAADGEPL